MSKSRFGALGMTAALESLHMVDLKVTKLKKSLANAQMIEAYGDIALEHKLSAPVVATMRATPGFVEAVKHFPNTSLFNIIPEHQNSAKQAMGLESLEEAQGENVSEIQESAEEVSSVFAEALANLEPTVEDLQRRIDEAKTALDQAEFPDEVVADLPVTTLSDERFSEMFSMVDDYLSNLGAFDVDHLRANPEKIKEEIDGLTDIVGDLGRALGIGIDSTGITEGDKDEDSIPSEGSVSSKGLTKVSLAFYLSRADGLLGELRSIAARKDELVGALSDNVQDIPEQLNSDEVTYGASEHITLLGCYATLTAKLIREAIVLITRLLTTTEEVVRAGNGEDYIEDTEA